VHLKAILRSDTPAGMKLLTPGTVLQVSTRDSQSKKSTNARSVLAIEQRRVDAEASGRRLARELPDHRDAPRTRRASFRPTVPTRITSNLRVPHVNGTFLVAAYRRPDFRVDAG
jgi:hypothetical protein